MAITPLSNADSYCPVGEALKRADQRLLCELCSDQGSAVAASSLLTNANLAAALLDASGDLEAALLVGGRYTPADLAALTGAALGKLYRLITRLAVCYLYERRPDLGDVPEVYQKAEEHLEVLRTGKWIFGTVEHANAGRPSHEVERARQVEAREGLAVQAEAYFGRRTNRTVL